VAPTPAAASAGRNGGRASASSTRAAAKISTIAAAKVAPGRTDTISGTPAPIFVPTRFVISADIADADITPIAIARGDATA
jgi:hypothetical protein